MAAWSPSCDARIMAVDDAFDSRCFYFALCLSMNKHTWARMTKMKGLLKLRVLLLLELAAQLLVT